jgi:hypothetical protein
MQKGDGFVYYSPSIAMGKKDGFQSFTAIGIVKSGDIYSFKMSDDFIPSRCDVDYFENNIDIKMSEIRSKLSFTNEKNLSFLRAGHIEIPFDDFELLLKAMVHDVETKT